MAIETSLQNESRLNQELEALQAILASQGMMASDEEAVEFSSELLDFFVALGEESDSSEGGHAC